MLRLKIKSLHDLRTKRDNELHVDKKASCDNKIERIRELQKCDLHHLRTAQRHSYSWLSIIYFIGVLCKMQKSKSFLALFC